MKSVQTKLNRIKQLLKFIRIDIQKSDQNTTHLETNLDQIEDQIHWFELRLK